MSDLKLTTAELVERTDIWRKNPLVFFKEVLEIDCTPNQKLIIDTIQRNGKITIKGCNSSGKSYIMSAYMLCYFYCHAALQSIGGTKVVFTAPQFSQIQVGLYAGLKKWIKKANKRLTEITGKPTKIFPKDPSEDLNKAMYWLDEENWIMGISAKGSNEIAGRHGDYVLAVFDEAQGIEESVYSGFKGLLQSGDTTEILIGNTTLPNGCAGKFYKSFADDLSEYARVTITSFETPNFVLPNIKPDDYFREEIDRDFWRNKLDRYCGTDFNYYLKHKSQKEWQTAVMDKFGDMKGLANPVGVNSILMEAGYNLEDYEVKTRIFAEFPDGAGSATFPLSWIDKVTQKYNDLSLWIPGKITMGIDFGRGVGKDKSAFCIINGNKCIYLKEFELDTIGILDKAEELYQEYNVDLLKLELNGEGVHFKRLLQEQKNLKVYGVDVSSPPGFPKTNSSELREYTETAKKLYHLKRDEMWWNLRLQIDPMQEQGGHYFLIPPDSELIRQMRASNYKYNAKGQIVVSTKDELKSRLKRSTDKLDCLLIAIIRDDYEEEDLFDYQHFHFKSIPKFSK